MLAAALKRNAEGPVVRAATFDARMTFEQLMRSNVTRVEAETQAQRQEIDERSAQLKKDVAALELEKAAIIARESEQNIRLAEMSQRVTVAEERAARLQDELLEASQTAAEANTRASTIEIESTATANRLQDTVATLQGQLADTTAALTSARDEANALRDKAKDDAAAATEALAELRRARGETQVRLEAALQAFDALQKERTADQQRHGELERQLREDLTAVRAASNTTSSELAACGKARQRLEMQNELSTKLLERTIESKSDVEDKLKEMSSHLRTAHAEIGKLAAAVRESVAAGQGGARPTPSATDQTP